MLTCIFPLHVTWFVGCIKGFLRRAHQSTPPAVAVAGVVSEPSPAPSATRPTKHISDATTPLLPLPPRPFRLRLSHRRQSFERALRSFRYDFLESPTSKRLLISNAVSAYIPRREVLYEWVGLRRRRRFVTLNAVTETPSFTSG
ncbi:hypothetical protein C0991_001590 [Blastosporella zonata]|nr:hypothetical protein C0991_001590 [Blastosporella zonata]